jgi:hypothetical protein
MNKKEQRNRDKHRKRDIKSQQKIYGENSELLKSQGYYTDVKDIQRELKEAAARRTVEYMLSKDLEDLRNFDIDYDLKEWVITTQLDPLLIQALEFGTATGRTLKQFAYWLPDRTIYGFDSWQGLPEQFNNLPAGHFAQELPKVADNCVLVQGWYGARPTQDKSDVAEFTARDFAKNHKEPIALLHLDADLYSSTKTVLDVFAKQIVPGTVILFDEYWNHPSWEKHEYKAWQEFVVKHNFKYEYIGYVSKHQEVAIRVLSKG